ncbi:chemotaxis protein CheW [Microscilla marina]|uniref:CheW protein n=1 Tax=Microscilla marina ATCC 23134 TaxID=313606 RepID=A1ZV34_MICM2|nr:chemotaxis protein CheW [Microscilla marina]EAY25690.1 CheW protein [Microscilla marina ATCC 23134]
MAENTEKALASYLTFTLGDEYFAAPIQRVREVLEMQPITRIPKTSAFARGILNLRGNILPIFDTRLRFGLETVIDSPKTRIIVLEINYQKESLLVGAVVDNAWDVVQYSSDEITPPPSLEDYKNAVFVEGILKLDEMFVMLINVDKIFSPSEMDTLTEMT